MEEGSWNVTTPIRFDWKIVNDWVLIENDRCKIENTKYVWIYKLVTMHYQFSQNIPVAPYTMHALANTFWVTEFDLLMLTIYLFFSFLFFFFFSIQTCPSPFLFPSCLRIPTFSIMFFFSFHFTWCYTSTCQFELFSLSSFHLIQLLNRWNYG